MLFHKSLVLGSPQIYLCSWQAKDNPSIKNRILHQATGFAKAAPAQHGQLPLLGPAFALGGCAFE
jgi:hypothetical protein